MQYGARTTLPTQMEIGAVQNLKPIFMRAELLDGSFRTVVLGMQTTAKDIGRHIERKLALALPIFHEHLCFGLFQVAINKGRVVMEAPLTDTMRLLDVIKTWVEAQDRDQAYVLQCHVLSINSSVAVV
jgi:hypothetical protein